MTTGEAAPPSRRLALYHPWVYLRGGVERLIVELVARSRHEWVVYTHHYASESTFPEFADIEVRELTPRVSVQREFGPLVRAATRMRGTEVPADDVHAMLLSSEGLGDLILRRTWLPAAAYCHTPLKILHDDATRTALTQRSLKHRWALRLLGPAFTGVDRRMWRRYRHVFANSAETRRRIAGAGLAPAGDVEVLRPGVDLGRFTPGPPTRAPMLLIAGRIMWQKHIELALQALRAARQGPHADAVEGLELVVAGALDDKSRSYLADLEAEAEGLPVRFVIDPPDDELIALYRSAHAVLFTARNEDWGIVPLEAMACGTPVVAIDAGGPRESVQHGRTGWLLPDAVGPWAERIALLARDPGEADAMRPAAVQRAEAFSWDGFVGRIDDVMEAVAMGVPTDTLPHGEP